MNISDLTVCHRLGAKANQLLKTRSGGMAILWRLGGARVLEGISGVC
jgi:hypothetical protein